MKKALIFTFFISIVEIILTVKQSKIYKCGVDQYKINPPIAGKEIPINYKSPLYRRRLQNIDNDGFKNLNIYLDFENLKEEIKSYKLEIHQATIIKCLQKAANILMSLLKVKPLSKDYYFLDSDLRRFNINYWEKEKFGDEANDKNISLLSLGIDLVIFSRFETYEKIGDEVTLATASPIFIDTKSYQPICGLVNINPEINFSKKGIEEYLTSIFIHELTHVLGFIYYYFDLFKFNFTKIDKYGINRFYLKSPNVIKVAKKYFNCSDIDGVELENDGGLGIITSHWNSRILLGEYMCRFSRSEELAISEFTLAYFEDTGYYKPYYFTGGLMRYGKNKGCSFIKEKCVSDYKIKPNFENEFFDSINYGNYDPSCSSGRLSRTYNYFSTYSNLPTYYQYFENETYGGYGPADYCPVPRHIENEEQLNYYSGSCSKLGDGNYGSFIFYEEEWKEGNSNYTRTRCYNNSNLERLTGEKYSDHSFCFLSSLSKKTEEKFEIYDKIIRAVCLESFCSSKSLTVKIHENYILCPRAGGKIELDEYGGYLLCPDYNLICTGTILCNNIFDCVSKKSEIKQDTYNYDYKIKTSQNIEKANIKETDNDENYELSENGQCPLNCKQCLENKKCIKCREDFEFVGMKNEEKRICIQKDELETRYYINGSIYYKCMDFCEKCENDTTCDKCLNNYDYIDNSCILKIQNCEEYNNKRKCIKCSENFALDAEKGEECISKEEFNDFYYTKDNGNSYYLCKGEGKNHIQNCTKCSYNPNYNIKLECNECQNGFVILDNETNRCYSKEKINEKEYYYINETHIKKCSKNIIHCNECESAEKCTKCENNFYLLNNEAKKCYNINEISPINEYYLDENNISYYSCNDTNFNSIENCKECNKKDSCSLCKDKYTFLDGNKSKCYEIREIGENYIIDPIDRTNYIKCSFIFNRCSSCNNSICLNCDEGYIFINDNFTKCLLKSSIDLSYYYSNDGKTYYSCKNEKYKSNPKCSKFNQEKLANNIKINLNNKDKLITNSVSISNQEALTTNSEKIIYNQESIMNNSETIISNQEIINTNPYTLTTSETIINNPHTLTTNSETIITTIIKSQIINPIITSIIKTTEPNNQIENIDSPRNIITIFFLQVKLKDKKLYLYLLMDSSASNDFFLKIKINIYIQRSLRNLQETKKEKEINLSPFNYTSSNSFGGLYIFASDKAFKEYLTSEGENIRIVVTNIKPIINNGKYEYNVEMGDNPDYLDTAKIEQMLQNNQEIDLDKVKSVNIYHLESISQGCSFEITTNETIKVPNRKLNLDFQEIKSHKKTNIPCSLKQNSNIIKCDLDEINNFILNDYIDFNNNELFSIISNKKYSFPIYCFFKYNKINIKSSSLSKGNIALIIMIPVIGIFIFASLVYYFFQKSKENIIIKGELHPTIKKLDVDSGINKLESKLYINQ